MSVNTPQSINIQFTTTSSTTFGSPIQQQTFLDTTNRNYLRTMFVSQDGVKLVRGPNVVQVPMAQLFSAAVSYNPGLTWPPLILNQPTSSTGSPPSTSSFFVSASSELAITYQWYSGSSSSGSWSALTDHAFSGNTILGSTTATLTLKASDTLSLAKYYECILTNGSGNTTSSVVSLTL